ncbi:MAG: LapA family protein [Candidatus Binatia bacterium]
MYLRSLLIIVVLVALGLFAAINWSAFTTQTTLSLIFSTVEAPLGLILLAVTGVLTLLFLIYLVYSQSSSLMESRRHARELQLQREIAENAEASRFSQLRSFLETELRELADRSADSKTAVLTRLDEADRDLRSAIEQSANTLAAYIGEVEDRLERASGGKN